MIHPPDYNPTPWNEKSPVPMDYDPYLAGLFWLTIILLGVLGLLSYFVA